MGDRIHPVPMFTVTLSEVIGVILSVIASIVIGGAWYSPFMFGRVWMDEIGLTEEKMKNMRTTPMQAISIAVILGALFAVCMNVLFSWLGVRTVPQGMAFAFASCLTFFVIPSLIHVVFEDTSRKAWAIYATHELLLSATIGAIVSWSILA